MLTANDIERTIYAMVKDSDLGKAVKGEIYRSNMRPPSSKGEDIVIRFLAGTDSQIQTGVVSINIYTKPIRHSGVEVDDKERCGQLMGLFNGMMDGGEEETGYILETDGTPRVVYDQDAKQYVIACRLRFTYLNI